MLGLSLSSRPLGPGSLARRVAVIDVTDRPLSAARSPSLSGPEILRFDAALVSLITGTRRMACSSYRSRAARGGSRGHLRRFSSP